MLSGGVRVAIMQPPAASSARWGPRPRRALPGPAPFLLLGHLGAAREPREPQAPGSQLRARGRRGLGLGPGRPPAPRAPAAPAPRGTPRTFPAADPPRPVAVPARAAPPRQEGRTLFAPVRPPLQASAAWSVRGGGRGREAGVAAVPEPPPPPPLSRPAPARPSPTRAGVAAQLLLLPFSSEWSRQLVLGAGGRRRSRSPARRHAPSCPPPSLPRPAAQQKAIYMRGSDPRPDRAPPPRGRRQKLGRRAALGARVRAPRTATPATLHRRRCAPALAPAPARPRPASLAPRPSPRTRPTPRAQLLARPRPGAISCRRRRPSRRRPANSRAHRLGRAGGRTGSSAARCRGRNKTQSGLRSWLGGRGRGAGSTGAELAGSERGSGEFQGLWVPGPRPQRRSFV